MTKKLIRSFIITLFYFQPAFCSHLTGGEITSRNIGGLTYEVKLINYFYGSSGFNITTGFNYSDSSGSWTAFHTGTFDTIIDLYNNFNYCIYLDTITFPTQGFYNIYFNECCRAALPFNMSSVSLYLHNMLFADSTNSSPFFLNPPIGTSQLGDTFNYNPLAYDPDGDSLVYSVDTPLVYPGYGDINYYLIPSDPSLPYGIDAQNGQMTFIPTVQGVFEMMILVKEYRNGFLIGSIERENAIGVIASSNLPMSIGNSCNISPINGVYNVNPNDTFKLEVSAYDPDSNIMNIAAVGEPFFRVSPPILSMITVPLFINAQLDWNPSLTNYRNKPYFIVVRTSEPYGNEFFEQDATYKIQVQNPASLLDLSKEQLCILSPNPTHSTFTFTTNTPLSNPQIKIYNTLGALVYAEEADGQLCQSSKLWQSLNGSFSKQITLHQPAGIYFVKLSDGEKQWTGKVVIE